MLSTRWTRDYLTGMSICSVCGALRAGKKTCCPCAPYVSFDKFFAAYFPGMYTRRDLAEDEAHYIPYPIAHEFYDDYLHSDCKSLTEYIEQTTSHIY